MLMDVITYRSKRYLVPEWFLMPDGKNKYPARLVSFARFNPRKIIVPPGLDWAQWTVDDALNLSDLELHGSAKGFDAHNNKELRFQTRDTG
jgi:hypothetical protein